MLLSVVMTKKEKEIENDARCYFILAYLFAYFLFAYRQAGSRKTSISALLTRPKPLTVWITINCGKF